MKFDIPHDNAYLPKWSRFGTLYDAMRIEKYKNWSHDLHWTAVGSAKGQWWYLSRIV